MVFNATLLVEGEKWMNKVVWHPMVEQQLFDPETPWPQTLESPWVTQYKAQVPDPQNRHNHVNLNQINDRVGLDEVYYWATNYIV